MAGLVNRLVKDERETLTEAYEVRAFRDDDEIVVSFPEQAPDIPHAETGALQAIKSTIKGHGEQIVLPG